MKITKSFQKDLNRFSEILVFLFVLAVFFFSLYKIINYIGGLKTDVWGFSSDRCGICEWGSDFCRQEREWCWHCWPPCPKPTPTSPPEPTPTLPPEVTPTPTLPPPPSDGGGPGPPGCGASVPNAPTLLSATKSGSEADLSWTAVDPVTHYALSYGLSSGDYLYGVDNTGNVTSFTVGGLDPALDYCFAVRAVHDCAPSELSNEICTGVVGQVLGATTLADTSSLSDELFEILFIIGCVCLSLGLRIYLPDKKNGLALILAGLFFLTTALTFKGYQTSQKNILSFAEAPKALEVVEEGDLPERVVISKVGIDLPVFPAKITNNIWEISDEGASYLLGSGIPGREGNVIIYGHNKNSLFGPIRWLEKDEEIRVINKKGEEFVYKIVEIKTVSPEMVEVLSPTEDTTLTLYTCTGFLDRERFVIVARLHLQ